MVASVAGERVNRSVALAARRARAPAPEFVTSQRRGGGVTIGYLEPWRLGVDRFVAAIGAHHLAKGRAVVVVGVGTAMTIDLVDAQRPPPGRRHHSGADSDGGDAVEEYQRHPATRAGGRRWR